jgi:hypothetical protein
MLRRTKFAVCPEPYTKHIHTLRENVEIWNVKPSGTNTKRWALKG